MFVLIFGGYLRVKKSSHSKTPLLINPRSKTVARSKCAYNQIQAMATLKKELREV